MHPLLQVAAGGAIGASLRYLVVLQAGRALGAGFPYGTALVNISGSFLMGILAVVLLGRGQVSPFLLTGVLGGFTTFSAFSLDAVALIERGQVTSAIVYVVVSVLGSIAALFVGLILARGWLA